MRVVDDLVGGPSLVATRAADDVGNVFAGQWEPGNPALAALGGSKGKVAVWDVRESTPVTKRWTRLSRNLPQGFKEKGATGFSVAGGDVMDDAFDSELSSSDDDDDDDVGGGDGSGAEGDGDTAEDGAAALARIKDYIVDSWAGEDGDESWEDDPEDEHSEQDGGDSAAAAGEGMVVDARSADAEQGPRSKPIRDGVRKSAKRAKGKGKGKNKRKTPTPSSSGKKALNKSAPVHAP